MRATLDPRTPIFQFLKAVYENDETTQAEIKEKYPLELLFADMTKINQVLLTLLAKERMPAHEKLDERIIQILIGLEENRQKEFATSEEDKK